MQEKLYIYYTNDLHSHFEQWPRTVHYLKTMKAQRIARGDAHWLFDTGDHMDRVNPLSDASMGKANVTLMNEIGYTLATIGNNEGITLSHDQLCELYDEANFPVIVTNLETLAGENPHWLFEQHIITSASGIRVGVIGLTAPYYLYYQLLGWELIPPYEALAKQLKTLENQVDVQILLSHLGINEDREIARIFPGIDLIIGGHTHHLLRTGERVHDTLITAAGKDCHYIGEVILTWDHQLKKLVRKEAYATEVTNYPRDEETVEVLADLQVENDKILNRVVTTLHAPIEARWFEETEIMNQLTDGLKSWTKADIAMLNAGLLLDSLPAGDVTYGDIHRICPHPINPALVELKGDEVIEVIRGTFKKEFMELELKGFGFRGKLIGRMHFAGVIVTTKEHANGEISVANVSLADGSALDPHAVYRYATLDTFTFGRLLPGVARAEKKHYFLPEFIREVFVERLKLMNEKE